MRLGVEARALFVRKRTGIPNYTWNVLHELRSVSNSLELFLYAPPNVSRDTIKEMEPFTLRQRNAPFGISGYFWTKLFAGKLASRDELDVFWAPRALYPLGMQDATPIVSQIYDLNHLVCPSAMPLGTLFSYRLWLNHDIAHADRTVAISEGTSRRMAELLGRPADAIVPPAVGPEYEPAATEAMVNVRVRHGLASPYVLFVGTLEPRKNLEALLDAMHIVNARRAQPLVLALAGQRGWRNKRLIARLDAGEPHVRELGYVPDADLPALYSGAEVFVIPSIYEGFGMPAAEARACGTRVVATDIPELREAAGPAATYAQPTAAGIAQGIEVALARNKPAPERPWTWRDSAVKLAAVLEDAARSRPKRR